MGDSEYYVNIINSRGRAYKDMQVFTVSRCPEPNQTARNEECTSAVFVKYARNYAIKEVKPQGSTKFFRYYDDRLPEESKTMAQNDLRSDLYQAVERYDVLVESNFGSMLPDAVDLEAQDKQPLQMRFGTEGYNYGIKIYCEEPLTQSKVVLNWTPNSNPETDGVSEPNDETDSDGVQGYELKITHTFAVYALMDSLSQICPTSTPEETNDKEAEK